MIDYALDNMNHDLQIKDGRFVTVISADEVAQRCRIHLQRYLAEWFLNIKLGLPYYEILLGSKDDTIIELYLRKEIAAIYGVLRVSTLNIVRNFIQRTLSVYVELVTTFGETVTVTIPGA